MVASRPRHYYHCSLRYLVHGFQSSTVLYSIHKLDPLLHCSLHLAVNLRKLQSDPLRKEIPGHQVPVFYLRIQVGDELPVDSAHPPLDHDNLQPHRRLLVLDPPPQGADGGVQERVVDPVPLTDRALGPRGRLLAQLPDDWHHPEAEVRPAYLGHRHDLQPLGLLSLGTALDPAV